MSKMSPVLICTYEVVLAGMVFFGVESPGRTGQTSSPWRDFSFTFAIKTGELWFCLLLRWPSLHYRSIAITASVIREMPGLRRVLPIILVTFLGFLISRDLLPGSTRLKAILDRKSHTWNRRSVCVLSSMFWCLLLSWYIISLRPMLRLY